MKSGRGQTPPTKPLCYNLLTLGREISDSKIVDLIQQDIDNFGLLYEKYFATIYRYCLLKSGFNREDTEDIVSQVFLRALENIHTADPNKHRQRTILPWLYTIARNLIVDSWRNRKKQPLPEDDEIQICDKSALSPFDLAQVDYEYRKVLKEITRLPDDIQDVIYMRIHDEMSFAEIASILDEKESAVKMRFYRGIQKVTKYMRKQ